MQSFQSYCLLFSLVSNFDYTPVFPQLSVCLALFGLTERSNLKNRREENGYIERNR